MQKRQFVFREFEPFAINFLSAISCPFRAAGKFFRTAKILRFSLLTLCGGFQ